MKIAGTFIEAAIGAVAVSDSGTGTIVVFSFAQGGHHHLFMRVLFEPKGRIIRMSGRK